MANLGADLSLWSDPPPPSTTTTTLSPTTTNNTNNNPVVSFGDSSYQPNSGLRRQSGMEVVPMFGLDQVQFELPSELVGLKVGENQLGMVLKGGKVLLVDLMKAEEILELELDKQNNHEPSQLFIDPTGHHIFVTTKEPATYYYHQRLGKFKRLNKLKGLEISTFSWDKTYSQQVGTGYLLVGTTKGLVFELFIEPSEEHFKKEERWIRRVYTLPDLQPITGLYCEPFPTSPHQYFILLNTPTRLYQFIVKANNSNKSGKRKTEFESKFTNVFSQCEPHPTFQEISGTIEHSETHFYSKFVDRELASVPSSFAWLTAQGIYHGNLVFGSQNPGESVLEDIVLTPYPDKEVPIALALTQFHFLLLYPDCLRAVSRLTQDLVYQEKIPTRLGKFLPAVHLTMDVAKQTFWVHTGASIYELLITQEDRDVWKFYLERNLFSEALQYAKTPTHKNYVLTTQAEQYFSTNRFHLAANCYGRSEAPLEATALKFIEKKESDALRDFLLIRLENLGKKDVTQVVLLSTWIVELYLSKINQMEDQATATLKEPPLSGSTSPPPPQTTNETLLEEIELLTKEFHKFLNSHKHSLDHKTTYHLMSSHGRTPEYLYFAELIEDHARVIGHYIQLHQFKKALAALSKQGAPELFYKFSPILMEQVPEELVSLLMRNTELDPKYLIPALLKHHTGDHPDDHAVTHQSIRYLQFVVQKLKNTDPAIHNLLLSLYASLPTENEASLLQFLVSESHERYYSLDYALRLCSQYHRPQSLVLVYGFLGLYEEAVNAALKNEDIELAKINADKADDNPELRKSLWLKIVRHIIVDHNDIKGAIALLQHCELLKIEDLLPFFPDFVLIDYFKDEICSALEEYNIHIEEIKHEMEEATRSAEMIRKSIAAQKSKFVMLVPEEKCSLCSQPVLTRQFYLFPCQHAFHSDCLSKKVAAHLKPSDARKLTELQTQLTREITLFRTVTAGVTPTVESPTSSGPTQPGHHDLPHHKERIDNLKEELDTTIASECPLCGDLLIRTIEDPFVTDQDFDLTLSWMI